MPQTEDMPAASLSAVSTGDVQLSDGLAIGTLSAARSQAACEIGAAMAHELNGPVTALLFYLGYLQQNSNRLTDADGNNDALKQAADSAFDVADRISSLIHRMGDFFEAPVPKEIAVAVARDALTWWAKASDPASRSGLGSGNRSADEPNRTGVKPLTPREREVQRLVSDGCSNKEGAALLKISYRTFECHRAEVMRKLGARNIAELVRLSLTGSLGSEPSPEQNGAWRQSLR